MEIETQTYLKELFYNPKFGLLSAEKLYKKVREDGRKITLKQIKEFMDKQEVNQVFKEDRRPEVFTSIVADGVRDEYQMDIMVYDRYADGHYKYMLFIIDIYSRYAEGEYLTNRENTTIINAIEKIFDRMGNPKKLSCDNEFNTKEFQIFCKKHNLSVYFSIPNDIQKNSIVERFNRTFAGYLKKLRAVKKYKWTKHFRDILDNYNNSYHRTIRETPFNIFFKGKKNKQDIIVVLNKFKIGDNVRIKIKKTIFDKGDLRLFSNQIYKIKNMGDRKILLDDGKYYSSRTLKKVNDIINYEPNEEEKNDEIEFNKQVKKRKINKVLKKEGLDETNIINTKRQTKTKTILNL